MIGSADRAVQQSAGRANGNRRNDAHRAVVAAANATRVGDGNDEDEVAILHWGASQHAISAEAQASRHTANADGEGVRRLTPRDAKDLAIGGASLTTWQRVRANHEQFGDCQVVML